MDIRCRTCGELNPERAKFCLECGAVLPRDERPGPGPRESRRLVTVVFADMVGFTRLGDRLDQESLRRVVDSFYAEMRAAIESESGTLAKFIGDAVLAVWGTPDIHEDDAPRAVRAAEGMRRRLDGLNDELERRWGVRIGLRTGINTGEIVVDPSRPADLLVGDALNVAARLEHAARDGEILLGPATWSLVRDTATLAVVEPLALKGKAEPMPAWRVIDGMSPDPRSASRLRAPLVGRDRELARLRSTLDATIAARGCRLVTVIGSPGLGKSRLVREFLDSVRDEATVLVGHCYDTGDGLTLQPIAEVLRTAAGIGEDDTPDGARALLSALVAGDEPDAARIADRAGSVLGLATPGAAEETFWAVRRVLELVARAGPVVLALDDVHWGKPMFFELIEHLVRWTRDAPVLVVALARPELRELRPALADPEAPDLEELLALEPLDAADGRALIGGLLGGELPAPVAARVIAATGGNPLFLGELVRKLIDDGDLRREGEAWALTGGAGTVAVPATIQALLSARIERLTDDERTVVERAAVIGHEFYRGAVAALVPPELAPGLDGTLDALSRKELVRPQDGRWLDERVFRFHHVLVRDAAYRSLLKAARAELHERFAEWLEGKAGALAGEHEEVIACHLEQAYIHRTELGPLDDAGRALAARAGARLASAARRALWRQDLSAAVNLFERALVPLAPDEAERMETLVGLADALLAAGGTARALEVIEELGEGARIRDDERLGAWATTLVADLDALTGAADLIGVVEAAADAAAVLARAGDGAGEARAWQVVAVAEGRRGRVAAAEAALDRALAAARASGDERHETEALAGAPRAALWGPAPMLRAVGRCMDSLRVLRLRPGRRHVEAAALRCQAVLEAMRGRADAAREILAECRAVFDELGLALELHETAVHAGMARLLAGEPAEAEVDLFGAREGFAALGADVPAALASALLGRALLEQNRVEAALAATRFAEEHAGEDLKATVTWLGVRAEALARGGEHDAARTHVERAVRLTEPTDALPDKADALLSLARVAAARGDPSAATGAGERALELYAAKGHRVGTARAREFVDAAATASRPAVPADPGVEARLARTAVGRRLLEYNAAYNARDWTEVRAYYAPGIRDVDHRRVPWEGLMGPEAWVARMQSYADTAPDSTMAVDRVVALEDDVAAVVLAGRGTTAAGRRIELILGQVSRIEGSRTVVLEFFDPDDEAGMLARVAELRTGATLSDLHASRVGRAYRNFTEGFNTRDWTRLRRVYAPGFTMSDHRALGLGEIPGSGDMIALLRDFTEFAPDARLDVERIYDFDEERAAIVLRGTGTTADGGRGEIRYGHLSHAPGGRFASTELFEPDDERAIRARFEELKAAGAEARRTLGAYADAVNHRDWTAVRAVFAPGVRLTDRRGAGPGDRDVEHVVADVRSACATAPDLRLSIDVLWDGVTTDGDWVTATLEHCAGISAGSGSFELETGAATTGHGGLVLRAETMDAGDPAAIVGRARELLGQ